MELNQYSDYGSGSSSGSPSSWMCGGGDIGPFHQLHHKSELLDPKSSYHDLSGKCTLEDVMREFRMNGSDSPYNPDEEKTWALQPGELSGMGPAGVYLRQKSWPEPERSPAQRLPRPRSMYEPLSTSAEFATSTPVFNDVPPAPFVPEVPSAADCITAEQSRVLSSIPDSVLFSLLRGMHSERRSKMPQVCRFCKNNGERESYYRSHVLKDARGRVACPVLRAFVCRRCGASGDRAHTIKYCPLATNEERLKSAAMMRSVHMGSSRRRRYSLMPSVGAAEDYIVFGEPSSSVARDNDFCFGEIPLDPLWAAVEKKLLQ